MAKQGIGLDALINTLNMLQSANAAMPSVPIPMPVPVQQQPQAQPQVQAQPAQMTFKDFVNSPALALFLGRMAQAMGPQGSWASNMGEQAAGLAQNQLYGSALNRFLQGQSGFQLSPVAQLTPAEAMGLNPKEQISVAQAGLEKRSQELESSNVRSNIEYRRAMAQAALEQNAINYLKVLASMNSGKNMKPVSFDLGDRVMIASFDPSNGEYSIKYKMKKGEKPGTGNESKTPAAMYSQMNKHLATNMFPILDTMLRDMYPNEKNIGDVLNLIRGKDGNFDANAVGAALGAKSPKLQELWNTYYGKLENAIRSGQPISSVKLPKLIQANIDENNNLVIPNEYASTKEPLIIKYVKDGQVKYIMRTVNDKGEYNYEQLFAAQQKK